MPHLVWRAFDARADVRQAVAMALHRALSAATTSELLHIDEICRRRMWYGRASTSAWWELSPQALDRLDPHDVGAQAMLIAASFHPSGYIRQAAVARLDTWTVDVARGREIGPLLIRANDWVPPVATTATHALRRRTSPVFAAEWVRVLPLLRRLGGGTRRSGSDLQSEVSEMLRAPEQRHVLFGALTTLALIHRREVLQLIRESEWVERDAGQVANIVLGDRDPIIRCWGIEVASAHLAGSELDAVLSRALADSQSAVRQRALDTVIQRDVDAGPLLERALLDPAASNRELARFTLRKVGRLSSFTAFYRRAITSSPRARELATAVRGLGETGDASDVDSVIPLLHHARPSVRVAAVVALRALDAARTVPIRFDQLADSSPRVARAAYDSLRSDAIVIGSVALKTAIRDLPFSHGRIRALAIAAGLPKWDSIPLLIDAIGSSDAAVASAAKEQVARWLERENRGFAPPRAHQIEALRSAVAMHRERLTERARGAMDRLMAEFSPTR